jgi:hypothetical protein
MGLGKLPNFLRSPRSAVYKRISFAALRRTRSSRLEMSAAIEETLLYPFTKFSLGFLKIPGLWLQSPLCRRVVATIFITINSIVLMVAFMELKNAPSDVEIIVPLLLGLTALISMYLKAIFIVWNKVQIQELHFSWSNVEGNELIILPLIFLTNL